MITAPADPVNRAYLRTDSEEHHDNAGPTLGTFTVVKIFYHHSYGVLACCSATCMPRKRVETLARTFLIRYGFKGDFSWSKAAAEHIRGPVLQFLRQEMTILFTVTIDSSSVTNGGPGVADCRMALEELFKNFCSR